MKLPQACCSLNEDTIDLFLWAIYHRHQVFQVASRNLTNSGHIPKVIFVSELLSRLWCTCQHPSWGVDEVSDSNSRFSNATCKVGLVLVAHNFTTALALACFNLVGADITVLCSEHYCGIFPVIS